MAELETLHDVVVALPVAVQVNSNAPPDNVIVLVVETSAPLLSVHE